MPPKKHKTRVVPIHRRRPSLDDVIYKFKQKTDAGDGLKKGSKKTQTLHKDIYPLTTGDIYPLTTGGKEAGQGAHSPWLR